MVMAVPSLKCVCHLRLVEYLIRVGYGCVPLENKGTFILSQLDQGAWGVESLAILDRVVKHYNFLLTPSIILSLLPSNAKRLALIECPSLTEDCLNNAIERCPNLDFLDLSENATLNLSNVDFLGICLFERRTSLTTVILENCCQVNDTHIQTLLFNAPNLQHLNVMRCDITDNAFLLNQQKQLAREACLQIGDLSWDSKLQTVDVSRCEEFTSTGVRYLCTLCGPTLQNINLSWTKADCTALLYLSGMGLPHAVQFFLSSNSMNSSVLESMVYTLHQFDAICDDIFDKWTSGDKAEQASEDPEKTEESAAQIPLENKPYVIRHSSTNIVRLADIQPLLGDSAAGNFDCVENFLDTDFSSYVADDKHQASANALTVKGFSDFHIDSDDSKMENVTQHSKNLSSVLSDDNTLPKFEKFTTSQDDGFFNCFLSVPDSHYDMSPQQSQDTKMHLTFTDLKKDRLFSQDANETIDNNDININQDDIEQAKCEVADLKCEDISKDKCDDNTDKCSVIEKTECYDRDREYLSNEKTVTCTSNTTLKSASTGFGSFDGNINLSKCDDNYSIGELRHISKEKKACANNNDTSDLPSTALRDGKDISKVKKYSSLSKIKMDFVPNITNLQVNGIVFRDETLGLLCWQMFLKTNRNLTSLSLYGGMNDNYVTDMIVHLIGHYCHNLTHMSIEGCDQVTDLSASPIVENCKKMDTLDLTGVPFIGDPGLALLLKSLPLTRLRLGETQITGISLDALSGTAHISEMKELDLSWCEEIAGEKSLNKLLELSPSLTRLILRETPSTASTFSVIASNCRFITELSIASNMNNVLDESVILLTENLPLLEIIDLGWNSHLTNKAIHSLFNNCHHLWNANLEGLKRINSSALVPIIIIPEELKNFYAENKLEEGHVANSAETAVRFEILPCLPYRSTTYCTELRHVNLKYSDLVEDARLQELVTVTQGGIKVIDYYGEEVEQSKSALENLLRRCYDDSMLDVNMN